MDGFGWASQGVTKCAEVWVRMLLSSQLASRVRAKVRDERDSCGGGVGVVEQRNAEMQRSDCCCLVCLLFVLGCVY